MPFRLKHYLSIILPVILIIGGIITIWEWLKPTYKLEAKIFVTKAPLPQWLKKDLNKLGDFSVQNIRKCYKDAPELKGVSDSCLEKTIPILSKVIKDRAELIMDTSPPGYEYLNLIRVHNLGNQTLTGVELRNRLHRNKMIAQIERAGQEEKAVEFSGNLIIGSLSLRSEITIYVYSTFPFMFDDRSTVITHDKGVGKISFFHSVFDF